MGSPASRVVANLCMEIIEKSAITASTIPTENLETLCWWQFNFLIIKKHSTSTFHDTLNSIDPKISFAIETENNGQISFLETIVTRKKKTVLSPLMFLPEVYSHRQMLGLKFTPWEEAHKISPWYKKLPNTTTATVAYPYERVLMRGRGWVGRWGGATFDG